VLQELHEKPSTLCKQGNHRHDTLPLVLPPGESLKSMPYYPCTIWPIMGKRDVIHKSKVLRTLYSAL